MCEVCGTLKGFGQDGNVFIADTYLECHEGTANKFWRLKIDGCTTIVTYGRVGTDGQTDSKIHNNEDAAKKFATKIQLEKERKGYSVPA